MVLPADSYVVFNKSIITEIDKKILIDLYQPIVGNKAVSLYLTLFHDLERSNIISKMYTHHHLLSAMQLSLEEIKTACEKLEAIGLLKTYLKKDSINNYIYVLYSPLSASEFFSHPILNVILYNNVGKAEYEKLVESYKIPRINLKDYEDISSSFDEVFITVPNNYYITNEDIIKKNKNDLEFKNGIDFELLISGLNSKIINERAFTKEVRYLIDSLCYLYNIDVLTMQDLIKSNLTARGTIDKEGLRKAARSYYQYENKGNLPSLVYSKQPEHLKSPTGDHSKKAKMIYTFENTSPYQFLKSKNKTGKVITREMNLIESLLVDLKLMPGVVNVLLDYVLRVNNQKLNRTYVETIASHWKRLGIETVEEAMQACIKEFNRRNKKFKETKKTEQIVPEWFDKPVTQKELNKEHEEELKNILKDYSD